MERAYHPRHFHPWLTRRLPAAAVGNGQRTVVIGQLSAHHRFSDLGDSNLAPR